MNNVKLSPGAASMNNTSQRFQISSVAKRMDTCNSKTNELLPSSTQKQAHKWHAVVYSVLVQT